LEINKKYVLKMNKSKIQIDNLVDKHSGLNQQQPQQQQQLQPQQQPNLQQLQVEKLPELPPTNSRQEQVKRDVLEDDEDMRELNMMLQQNPLPEDSLRQPRGDLRRARPQRPPNKFFKRCFDEEPAQTQPESSEGKIFGMNTFTIGIFGVAIAGLLLSK
jgi:hypothetical protein